MAAYGLTTTPVVDGDVLGDDAWSGVSPASDFWQIKPN